MSGIEIQKKVASGDVSAVEVTNAFLERITHQDRKLHAFLYVDAEGALAQAATVDRARKAGETLGPLAGVPVALKDNLCTRGVPTTCASKILAGYVPPYDADAVERLRRAGAIAVGKTNMDEFAMGSSNENSAFGPVKNPWDETRAPGGSSGGSAAATASSMASFALGSDTGGSVRQPGAFCGVTALKPTYGRVSRFGLIAFASSLDQIGPFARSVREAARVLSVIAGHDARDATSTTTAVDDYEAECGKEVRGLRVGVVADALGAGVDAEVVKATRAAVAKLAELGCEIVDVSLPHATHALAAYYLIAPAEASSNLARFDGMRYGLRKTGDDLTATYGTTRAEGFGPEVRRRIMLGTYALSAGYYDAFYVKAQKVRTLIRRDYDAAFKKCDVVLTPTSPTTAFKLGEKTSDPLAMYMADIFTLPPSLAGLPAVSIPGGYSADGLPIGLQLTGRAFDEKTLVRVSDAYERASGWLSRRPSEIV
ncbi:MAG: Asp-tRNA(Asn)/Glu-tRNA(Gln) amidotransferase subunit GatA [Sandaracinaceae bacterium]|nr:Asp-tRNA(Asn)/Glu-tRNA(Gln) amidotransferase subunit GatA [Sandaracinaceae bacterium]